MNNQNIEPYLGK